MSWSECEKVSTPISESISPGKPKELQCRGLHDQNDHEYENKDAHCAATVGTKTASDKRDAQSIFESQKQLAKRNYKVMVLLRTTAVWVLSLAVLDIDAGSNLVKEDIVLTVWDPPIEKVKESSLQPASNAPMKFNGMLSLEVQVGQLQKKVGFIEVPTLATTRNEAKTAAATP